jgi:putative tryptophan/tyrosine transport system substrate-binding protein
MKILGLIRHLWLGALLIAATSSILLITDLNQRRTSGHLPRVAVLQHASQATLDEGVRGIIDGLAEHGFVDGKTMQLQRFNAENDIGTANAIAREITSGGFDLVVTSSTLSMQSVANANKSGKVKHVFGIVADPFGAGVGVSRENPLDHPKYMTGIGSMIPPERAFVLAREMFPALKTVGLVWNPGESNSRSFTIAAREACKRLGITLLEANADNSSNVQEAAGSLISRGAQALWISGDVTVLVAADAVTAAAKKAHIPAFSIIPPTVKQGALFDIGANFYEVGKQVGDLAAKVLNGADPASIPVVNLVPEKIAVNTLALAGLRDPWKFPPGLVERAQIVVDAQGLHDRSAPAESAALQPGRIYKLGVVYFAPEEGADLVLKGLFETLSQEGFTEGKNLEVKRAHAQAEISNIPALLQNFDSQPMDLIVTLTTPCLTGACAMVKHTPVVFTYVYDPIAAGAGKSATDHLPFLTGVGSFPPVGDTIELIRKLVPGVKTVGTLYNSSEANSRKVVSVARGMFADRGIHLEEVTITGTNEILQAAQVLTHRNIQAMWVTGDNTALQGFDAIAKAARDAKLPLIINDPEFTDRGAVASVGLGWYQAGQAAGKLASRVLRGESPSHIPFEEVAIKKIVLNKDVAKTLGITFPADVLKEASQ